MRVHRSMVWPFVAYLLLFACVMPVRGKGIPRPEHPKPQFERSRWVNLNGQWDFAIDPNSVGLTAGWHKSYRAMDRRIVVPFCPESKLSGIEERGFMDAVWYHRSFAVPKNWDGGRIFLHFGGVDFDCRVWVNGTWAGRHYGGSVSFDFEITDLIKNGLNHLTVYAADDVRSKLQPAGKQSRTLENEGCCRYTRTTGIWQTVWLEHRGKSFIDSVQIIPDLDRKRFAFIPVFDGATRKMQFQVTTRLGKDKTKQVVAAPVNGLPVDLVMNDPNDLRLWSPDDPYLYDLKFELVKDDKVIDSVKSYAGMRKFHIEGNRFYLNNKPIFLRFVLDQGFYSEGVWTAPTDAALRKDIELAMAAGFNGARLHQKVFEERFHYWADKLGYLTWGEYSDWGISRGYTQPRAIANLQNEWRGVVVRDRNHPSIVAWTPLNEAGGSMRTNYELYRRNVEELYNLTRALDLTRPINDVSGFTHVITDIYTVHDYVQSSAELVKRCEDKMNADTTIAQLQTRKEFKGGLAQYNVGYAGQPFMVAEYGGTFWLPSYAKKKPGHQGRAQWGFGRYAHEVENVIEELTLVLLADERISGLCYTQLTDVEQEVNGLYTFDRKEKFDVNRLKAIFSAPAAMEK